MKKEIFVLFCGVVHLLLAIQEMEGRQTQTIQMFVRKWKPRFSKIVISKCLPLLKHEIYFNETLSLDTDPKFFFKIVTGEEIWLQKKAI